jgi:AbrB family looped-hinge helix DNA binding protein
MTATVSVDKAGRLVLPKPIRERLRLRPGTLLKAEIVGDKIELSQEIPKAKIVRKKDGLPVVVGWEGFDAARAVREMREEQAERLDRQSGK